MEAVSNGVQAFREPVVPAARKTLTIIVLTLVGLLGGIATLVYYYGISATDPGQPGYQSVLSLVTAAVAGRGVLYGLTMFSVLLVLCLSANTSFADFPRLCRAVAMDDYLPHSLTLRGRRLVYSQGIWVLALLAAVLLIIFGGVTDRLIPLFAVGAFLAFTLSQAGMVVHWRKNSGSLHPHAGQRNRSSGNRSDRAGGGRRQIHPGRMDRRVVAAGGDCSHGARAASLPAGNAGDRGQREPAWNQQPPPADRDCAHRPMERRGPEDSALCHDAFSGGARRARGLRRRRQHCRAMADVRSNSRRSKPACPSRV